MRPLRFLSIAEAEMGAAARYYESKSPNLGHRFLQQIEKATAAVRSFPNAGAIVRGETRRRLVRAFPFALPYRTEGEEILAVAVMGLQRDPGYWLTRT